MKVKIGPYKNYIGPYQIARILCFWVKKTPDEHGIKSHPKWVHKFGEWLAYGSIRPKHNVGDVYSIFNDDRRITLLHKICMWVQDMRSEQTVKVRIDNHDTWSMDHTLGYIVLPMLKQLKKTMHGSPQVEDNDVPEELRSTAAPPKENDYDTDDNHFKRWDWVIDEMIFAFETKSGDLQDWSDQFHTGNIDMKLKKLEDGNSQMVRGPEDTSHFDAEGYDKYQARISNGFRLFGKYFESLWD